MNTSPPIVTTPSHDSVSTPTPYLFNDASHCDLHRKLGSHLSVTGAFRGLISPFSAECATVSVELHFLESSQPPQSPRGDSGIWEGFIAYLGKGSVTSTTRRTTTFTTSRNVTDGRRP
jgi:1,4-alpha-glucan branching enzyme